jgi:hypothetical protein
LSPARRARIAPGGQHVWGTLPDRVNHGGADYSPWFLDTMRQRSATPDGGCSTCSRCTTTRTAASAATTCRRRCSSGATDRARALWNPTYVDETWINDRVRLIPRLRGWVTQ